jgi:hypothetical protein
MSNGNISIGPSTPLIAGDVDFTNNLSPDAMMIYLQTRLDGIDSQVNSVFNDQKRQEKAQSILRDLNTHLTGLDDKTAESKPFPGAAPPAPPAPDANANDGQPAVATAPPAKSQVQKDVEMDLAALDKIDPALADRIRKNVFGPDRLFSAASAPLKIGYTGAEAAQAKTAIEAVGKDLESSAQMNMIHLQSLISSRQTAVQLATNMVSSLGESTKSIVANLGH